MNDLPQLPDFLTLYKSDAVTPTSNSYTWNIPDSYYSNVRTSTCYVTLVNIAIQGAAGTGNKNFACVLKDGAPNYSSTKNNGIVLGFVLSKTNATVFHYPTGAILQPMIKSNPQTLTIEFTDLAGTITDIYDGGAGEFVLSLRFDYISPISQAAGLEGTFQPNLLR